MSNFHAPFNIIAKPIGAICNLDCEYCYYLEKEDLYPGTKSFKMTEETLENYTRQYIYSQPADTREVNFVWQGGEPTLLGLPFFKKALKLQQKYARPGMNITNSFQTNGTRLDDEWAAFFTDHDFLVGISIDGPEDLHDEFRPDKGGYGSFHQVMEGLEYLKKHQTRFNTLTCVQSSNSSYPVKVYRFLKEIGSTHLQFIPIVEPVGMGVGGGCGSAGANGPAQGNGSAGSNGPAQGNGSGNSQDKGFFSQGLDESAGAQSEASSGKSYDSDEEYDIHATVRYGKAEVSYRSVHPKKYGTFLCGVFDEWLRRDDVGRIFVQDFDVALNLVAGYPSPICIHAETCGHAMAVEHNGDIYSCDHFVYPDFKLGNIADTPLKTMHESARQEAFGLHKRDGLPRYCMECDYRFVCNGGCPKDRIIDTPDGEEGLNYLCQGYKTFYAHSVPVFRLMAKCLEQGIAPRDYRQLMPKGGGKKRRR